ncbi:hypothetical protein [Belnapia moabensis]|uniref:hypothetical protein n=1 Tax=Belnapia moabensis TaxID=365533 RepID=UPI0005B9DAE9|nr:hypothetical protein [Belnapia moabensis]
MLNRDTAAFAALHAALVELALVYAGDAARFILHLCDAAEATLPSGNGSLRMSDKLLDLRDEASAFADDEDAA